MRLNSFLTLALTCGISAGLPLPTEAEDKKPEAGFVSLFDGKTLKGWEGNPELWSVEDGAITGKTSGPETLTYNQFLIWQGGVVKNFELHAQIRVEGNNSGIQYRSKAMPEIGKWSIGGYQCDVHPTAANNAMLYHERGRGIVAKNGQSVAVDKEGRKWQTADREPVAVNTAEWNEYTIIAKGNHLTHMVNGQLTAQIDDYDEKDRSLEGLLALQIHQGPAMKVQVKDIRLKVLPDGGVTPFAKADIPSDSQEIMKPKPRPAAKGKGKAMPKGKGAPAAKAKAPAKPKAKAKVKAKAKPKSKRPQEVGPAIGENTATPVDRVKVPEGFQVELLYSVPGGDQGSWVALASDENGEIYASDQYGDLYHFPAPAPGEQLQEKDVKKVPVNIRAINGMVFADGHLYAGVNDYEQEATSGFYKISDSDNDGELDKVELLRAFESKSDHGVHAVVPTPDGKHFYLITGNNAVIDEGPEKGTPDSSPVAKIWGDDHLLPRMPDGRGHNRSVLAPGGIIYRISRDGKEFEIFASGFRNIYGGSLNKQGELFTYDADMEYDFNTPWYRPTRVNHVVSGGEYGWRNGAGKYPEFYAESLPSTLNIGPGSPTGTLFGYGAKFPRKYQEAYYVMDWSWGKVYAVSLEQKGATYVGTKEEFITGAPLPVTDGLVHPKDGAMYFAIGGRRVQSGLYRVTYVGDESTELVTEVAEITAAAKLRHELEAFHGVQSAEAIAAAWAQLDHADRWVSSAARVILEHQPAATWQEKALKESSPDKQAVALLALARLVGTDPQHRAEGEAAPDSAVGNAILNALVTHEFASLKHRTKLTTARALQVAMHRFGEPDEAMKNQIIAALDPSLPSKQFDLNWLLLETLAYLQAPSAAGKGIALLESAISQEEQMEHARSLRMVKTGWTSETRVAFLNWFLTAANYKGGASFTKFIEFIRNDALATFSEAEKKEHAELIAKKAEVKSAIENVGAIFVGRTPTMWTLDELSKAADTDMKGRDYSNGRKMFAAAACYACHRFADGGGMTGPDLTGSGGRYSPHDFLDQIIHPSKEINEQFAPIVVTKNNGEMVSGVVVNLSGDNVTLNTDVSDPNQRVNVDRKEVKSLEVSKVSPMPPMLLSMLTKEEVLDLVAYALSGGDETNEMFKK